MKYLNAFIVLFLVNTIAFAQVPDAISGINYQGIAREADGTPIPDDLIGVRVTIFNNSNPNLFQETHNDVPTNQFGLFTLIIGSINTLQSSLWESATKIKTEADFGSGYTEIATVDLAAVPYAFKAKYEGQEIDFNTNSGYLRISNGTKDANGNPVFIDSTQISVSGGGTNLPSGGSNGQVLSTDGSGNYSWVNDNTNDNDSDPVNEIQDLQLIGDSTIRLSDVSGNTNSEIHVPNDNQNLSLNGTVISIEDGNTIDLANIIPSGGTDDQNLDSAILNNNILTTYIEGGSAASVNLSSFLDNTDAQTLSLSGNSLSITGGNTITLPSGTDNQDLSLSGNNLTLTNDGTPVNLSSFLDNTDAQYIDTLELHTGNILGISLSNDNVAQSTIDLSSLASADNDWAKVGGGTISSLSDSIYTNGNVGIGTSSPSAKLDVKTNSSSTDGLYIGQSNTLPQLVVKAGGNVGIGTSSPSTKLEVNGNTTSANFLYTTPKTRYYNIGEADFGIAASERGHIYRSFGNGGASIILNTGGGNALLAPVHLPHGSVVTNIDVLYVDNSSSADMSIAFNRRSNTSGSLNTINNPAFSTSSNSTSNQTISLSGINTTINNNLYNYSIRVYSSGWPTLSTPEMVIKGIKITYTVSKAD